MYKIFRLNEKDNVAVVLFDAQPGQVLNCGSATVTVTEAIPFGHKVALVDFKEGDLVYKYGYVIGRCTKDTPKGGWMHVHNIVSCRGERTV